jgi:hypothetical protein
MRSILFFLIFLTGCYAGPGLTRVESDAIIKTTRDLNPYPIIEERGRDFGQRHIAPVLDSTLSPLILDEDEQDPQGYRQRAYEENMRRQEEALRALEQEEGY